MNCAPPKVAGLIMPAKHRPGIKGWLGPIHSFRAICGGLELEARARQIIL
jgi:hypothetical protein